MKHFVKDAIILFISMLLIFIICYSFFFKKKEGFGLKDIDNMFGDVKNITKVVGNIPNEINNIDNKLTQQVNNMGNEIKKQTEEMGKEIEKNTINILTKKLGSIFIQIGDIFNKGIIEPILALFNGIGNIFLQIFNILKEVGNKIVSLPNCIFTYAIKETINTFNYLYNKIIPKFLRNIISFIYRYTFRYLFEFIGYITGYDNSVQKCYGFNVSSQVDNINSSLNKIQSSFKTDFGNLDFSQISI
jgi:hypothetical protein